MKLINLFKAQKTNGMQTIENVTIRIEQEFPIQNYNDFLLNKGIDLHIKNAKTLFDVIIKTLPGGTIDQLLVMLLQEKVSRLVVPADTSQRI